LAFLEAVLVKKPTKSGGSSSDGDRPPWDTGESVPEPAFVPEGPGLFGGAPELAPITAANPYVVLARKYRPQSFPDLIGQDAMVTTLRNAFASGRIAQGYMLTGVRGVGKTTTARILARGLNYEIDGSKAGPTVDMPVLGRHCADIIASRHPDVVEMDAASNTGIDNIREIIESARYKPIVARTKVFIIDEVHMLSKGAFNALLKTLEEPPEHVKFIFATTEIRKVPVTVLSRCQRFDLRRVEVAVLAAHFKSIVAREGAVADDDALALIARAAEGSVRDGLSILDQAIAMSLGSVDERVTAAQVRAMLGLADRGRIFDLLELVASGAIAPALEALAGLHQDGAEASQVLAELAEAVHQTARAKVVGSGAASEALSLEEKRRASALGAQLSVPLLSRLWQMLLKGHEEASRAGDPLAAAEMVLIRIAHTSDLPSPDELIRMLGGAQPQRRDGLSNGDGPSAPRENAPLNQAPASVAQSLAELGAVASDGEPQNDWDDETAGDVTPDEQRDSAPQFATVRSFGDVVALVGHKRDVRLKIDLEENVSLVKFDAATNSIDLFLLPAAAPALPNELREKLNRWTNRKWVIVLSKAKGEATLGETRRAREAKDREILEQHPAVAALRATFPEAKLTGIRTPLIQPLDEDDETATG
jgi:DNA polymerase III subunit gamma/tau